MTSALFVGISTIDIAYLVDDYPEEDSKTQAADQFIGAGGPAANAAVTYAFLAKTEAKLLTALGSHSLTDIARADLEKHGVRPVDVIAGQEQQLPISSVIVSRRAQTRTLVSLDASRIDAPCPDLSSVFGEEFSVVLVDGHYAALSVEAAMQAQARGIPVVLDAGRWKDVHNKLLPLVDVAICSAAFQPPGVADQDVLKYLEDVGVKAAAITNGQSPIIYRAQGRPCELAVASSAQVIDTLGAGDILHGAFCYYFGVAGQPFPDALASAAQVATLSCQHFGTREWMRH